MTYAVKEMFKTIQGEGINAGRAAVFVRFAGCNLWNGRESGRGAPACAQWCDTDFVGTDGEGGGRFGSVFDLRDAILRTWDSKEHPFVVFTGGEPTLQLDKSLVNMLTADGLDCAVETNGTTDSWLPPWWSVCVSPKGNNPLVRTQGAELKLIFGQPEEGAQPYVFETMASVGALTFKRYYLQPMEPLPGGDHDTTWKEAMAETAAYVQEHPFWRLSLQTHKWIGLP